MLWFSVLAVATGVGAAEVSSSQPAPAASAPSASVVAGILDSLDAFNSAFEAARRRGDEAAALQLLADHFASRPRLDFDPRLYRWDVYQPHPGCAYVRDTPNDVLQNRFAVVSRHLCLGPGFDWNSLYGTDEREIAWWVNRFFFLDCLPDAWRRTRDARYPRHGTALVLDWIRRNPVERAEDLWAAWRPLEVGLRLVSWSLFVDSAARDRLIAPADLALILNSIRQQMEYLTTHSGPGRVNHGFMENSGLAVAAVAFPEIRGSRRSLDRALAVLAQDAARQVYPDGSQEEMSPHYETTVVISLARVADLARQRGFELPRGLVDALKRAASYLAPIRKPDGTLPMLNDGDAVDFSTLLALLADRFGLEDVRAALASGGGPAAPWPLCRTFAHSGVTLFRDGWGPDARYLLFEHGPYGTAHQHEDANLIDVAALGRHFIVDPGRHTYPDSPLRRYFLGTRSHATVMVDGSPQVRAARRETWRQDRPLGECLWSSARLALAVGDYDAGYAAPAATGVTHRREVLFVDRDYWVVGDVLLGTGRHRIELNFQVVPCQLELKDGTATTRFPDANLALLWHWPAAPDAQVRTGQHDPPAGWYCPVYGRTVPAPLLTLAADLALPARLTTLLVPYRGPTPPRLAIESVDADPRTGVLRFIGPRGTDWIRLGDPRAPAEACRLAAHTTTAPAAVVTGGSLLEIHP